MGRSRRYARAAARALALAAALVMSLIAFVAVVRAGAMLDAAWRDFPEVIGLRHVVVIAGYLAIVVLALRLIRLAPPPMLRRWSLIGPLLALVAIRALAIVAVPTPIPADNDPRFLHLLAVGALDGGNWLVSHRPMGFSATLAVLYAAFGVNPWLAEVLNLGFAILAGVAIHALVAPEWGRRVAAAGVTLYALAPSQLLLVTAIFTETMYAALLLVALALAAHAVRTGRVSLGIVAGVALAASQYVRPMSQAFVVGMAAVALLVGRLPRAALLAGALVLAFVVAMLPIAAHNLSSFGELSLSTSSYGGWSVFVGANQEHNGMFNRDDQAILRDMPQPSVWERSRVLGREGVERILDDPRAFASLAVRKFQVLWADDAYAAPAAFPGDSLPLSMRTAIGIGSQLFYAGVTVLAALRLWRTWRRPRVAVLLVAVVVVISAAAHTFLEVQPRYHAYLVPLFCVLGAAAVVSRGRRSRSRARPPVVAAAHR